MKKQLLLAVMSLALASGAQAQLQTLALDVGANYGGSGEPAWTNGSNAGFGFGAWTIDLSGGGFKGNFIGDPAAAGISGMSAESFGLYAKTTTTGARVIAERRFTTALQVGQTFSLDFGMNAQSGFVAEKSFSLYTGNSTYIGGVQNYGENNTVLFLNNFGIGTDTGFGYGTNPMTWSFTYNSPTNLLVTANDRDGFGTFTTNVTVTGGLSAFGLTAYQLQDGDASQPYFNNFTVTVPEPSTYALLGLGALALGGHVLRRRRR